MVAAKYFEHKIARQVKYREKYCRVINGLLTQKIRVQ